MTSIYLLYLEQHKYYVGRSNDPVRRYKEHLLGEGSQWIKVYAPKKLVILKEDADPFDEDKYVKIQMMEHGIANVRGGSYCKFHLDAAITAQLYKEITGATDRCFNCGQAGHFAQDCTRKTKNTYTTPKLAKQSLKLRKCSNCGQPGHNIRSCKQ